jgi:hypothetical protein
VKLNENKNKMMMKIKRKKFWEDASAETTP